MASIGTDRSGSSHLPAIPARLRSPLWLLLLLCSTLNSKGSDAQTVPDVNNVDPSKLNVMTSEQKYELTARQCWFYYSEHMENISREDWCEWDMISSLQVHGLTQMAFRDGVLEKKLLGEKKALTQDSRCLGRHLGGSVDGVLDLESYLCDPEKIT
ncbi:receptor activity-modifying protein 2 isoform X2 [Dromiciops gliroides]|uniref:receptor activity-modifying protein 2 isoform X2 n=1 Tax=Dromiciops gliroides TaxID=33562 RepID=UPI001CC5CA11|nr:receptor activity-modifying protein 2 isoform X2 [Dromiciops gliroides]